jgi:hypothetical protein
MAVLGDHDAVLLKPVIGETQGSLGRGQAVDRHGILRRTRAGSPAAGYYTLRRLHLLRWVSNSPSPAKRSCSNASGAFWHLA